MFVSSGPAGGGWFLGMALQDTKHANVRSIKAKLAGEFTALTFGSAIAWSRAR
jgi:hypothetical protein